MGELGRDQSGRAAVGLAHRALQCLQHLPRARTSASPIPILYQVAATDPSAFNDVTVGDNDLTGKLKGKYPATVGYDMATGLGTPNVSELPAALCGLASTDPVSVTNPGGQRTHLDATVSLQSGPPIPSPARSSPTGPSGSRPAWDRLAPAA